MRLNSRVHIGVGAAVLALLGACSGGGGSSDNGGNGGGGTTAVTAEWLGLYALNDTTETPLHLTVTATDTAWTGTYEDLDGFVGTLQGTPLASGALTLSFNASAAGCQLLLSGNGQIVADAMSFTLSGTRCGTAESGLGVAIRQTGHVVSYGQEMPHALVVGSDRLIWLTDGPAAVVSAPKAGGTPTRLAWRMSVPTAVRSLPNGDLVWVEDCSGLGGDKRRLVTAAPGNGARRTLDVAPTCNVGGSAELMLDGASAYWQVGAGGMAVNLRKVPLDGSPPATLATVPNRVAGLAIDSTHLYWVESQIPMFNGALRRIPLAGGAVQDVVPAAAGRWLTGPLIRRGDDVIFAAMQPGDAYSIQRADAAGGTPTTLVDIPVPAPGADPAVPGSLMAVGPALYWIGGGALRAVPLSGGAPTVVASGLQTASALVSDGVNAYWAEATVPGAVRTVPLAGGTPRTLAIGVSTPRALDVDASQLLVAEGAEPERFGQIRSMRLTDGLMSTAAAGILEGRWLASAGADLYVADGWRIKKLPLTGGTPEVIANAQFFIDGLATDGASLYFSLGPVTLIGKTGLAGGAIDWLASGRFHPGPVRVRGGRVYWLDHEDTISSVPAGGGTVTVHVSGAALISDLAVDDDALYWNEWDTGRVMRMPLAGGMAAQLATGQRGPAFLAVDAGTLFRYSETQILGVPTAGGTARIVADALRAGNVAADSIGVDRQRVYWIEAGVDAVKSIAR